jgi:hypothetical protein
VQFFRAIVDDPGFCPTLNSRSKPWVSLYAPAPGSGGAWVGREAQRSDGAVEMSEPAVKAADVPPPVGAGGAPHARRMDCLAEPVRLLGDAAGGRPAERLMTRSGMPTRDDTILRHLKRRATTSTSTKPIFHLLQNLRMAALGWTFFELACCHRKGRSLTQFDGDPRDHQNRT